jgi:hypothetical protein
VKKALHSSFVDYLIRSSNMQVPGGVSKSLSEVLRVDASYAGKWYSYHSSHIKFILLISSEGR